VWYRQLANRVLVFYKFIETYDQHKEQAFAKYLLECTKATS